MKKIGIMTTGGDCSGLNAVIANIVRAAQIRGWRVVGITDGTDGLTTHTPSVVDLDIINMPPTISRTSGSILGNGHAGIMNFETATRSGQLRAFNNNLKTAIRKLKLDVIILVGGNGSLSLAWTNRDIYSDVQLICIPKTIDMDIPCTSRTIGFDTAVQQLVSYCDQLILTARSHHRWFVVQSMGRDCGQLALNAGVAAGVHAILIPEIKFDMNALIAHIKHAPTDYGIIIVAEGIRIRGHSGQPAEIISRKLTAAGIPNRTAFPGHIQRAGDTTAADRILAIQMADATIRAIENNETYVMTAYENDQCRTITLADFYAAGRTVDDPNISGLKTSNAYVTPDNPLLHVVENMGIYIGERRK
ncbi:MAG: 6-phosphofructokinase [Alphaproteobacteria bacterium]|nr:6-phosphofructokinase [Alphaproteobacteria bacterium]